MVLRRRKHTGALGIIFNSNGFKVDGGGHDIKISDLWGFKERLKGKIKNWWPNYLPLFQETWLLLVMIIRRLILSNRGRGEMIIIMRQVKKDKRKRNK